MRLVLRAHSGSRSHGVRWQHRRHCLRGGIRAQPGWCRRCAWDSHCGACYMLEPQPWHQAAQHWRQFLRAGIRAWPDRCRRCAQALPLRLVLRACSHSHCSSGRWLHRLQPCAATDAIISCGGICSCGLRWGWLQISSSRQRYHRQQRRRRQQQRQRSVGGCGGSGLTA